MSDRLLVARAGSRLASVADVLICPAGTSPFAALRDHPGCAAVLVEQRLDVHGLWIVLVVVARERGQPVRARVVSQLGEFEVDVGEVHR